VKGHSTEYLDVAVVRGYVFNSKHKQARVAQSAKRIAHRVRSQESESGKIAVQGTRCKVQGKALKRSHIIPCTLYPAP
jgi:hypothetical protein